MNNQETPIPIKKLLLRISLRLLLIIGVLLFLVLLVPSLLDLFLPFVLAFIVASALAPLVRKFTKKMGRARSFWSMLFVLLLILAVTGFLIYLGYYLFTQIADLIGSWDIIQGNMTDTLNRLSGLVESGFRLTYSDTEEYLLGLLQQALSWLTDKISAWAPTVVSGVGSLASGIANFLISLLFFLVAAYFMTSDYPGLHQRLVDHIPSIIHPHMRHVKAAMGSAMFGYLRAQLILSGIVTLICFLALLIWGQSYAILIALACGIIDFVPFFGSGVVLVPWAVLSLFWGDYKKALFLTILALALFLFRKLAEPKVVGNQTGLSPLASLISIYVGMKLGGVLGMILCPILCMILVGLYGMGFFDPTISDFRQLLRWILHAAQLDTEDDIQEDETT
jgi:sporulation integral membrane protein YtvI